MNASLVYMTFPDKPTALAITRTLLEERLIACVNIVSPMHSLYWWEEKIEEATETVAIGKTLTTHLEAIKRRVQELHPYDVPCVIAIEITDGLPDFLGWIAKEVGEC